MVPVALVVALALLIAFVVRAWRQYRALEQFGGHWSAGWSRLWLLRTSSSGEMHTRFTELNKRYGSTARIAPHTLITSDPDLMRRMSAVRSPFTRGPWYKALRLHPERDNIVSYTDEGKHADLRNRMAPGYSGKENLTLQQDVDERLHQLFELVRKEYISRPEADVFRTMDLGRISTYFTLDVISQVAFGQTFGFLEHNQDPFGYIESLAESLPAMLVLGVYTELIKILDISLLKAALPKSTDKRGLGRVMGYASERVRERFGNKPLCRPDMLQAFIKKGLTQSELESETLTQITAGSDSTAAALRMTLHFITTNPRVLERLLTEARAGIAAGRISRPIILDSEARKLPYLQACIKEGLRLYPPVTGILPKRVPDGGVEIDVDGVEKFVPGGTQIGWNSWGMMRRAAIFGPDVEIFRPERWLSRDGSSAERDRVTRMTDTVSLCFGYGRFGCLGRGVATMELNKAIFETLQRFHLQPCSLSKPFDEKVVGFYLHENMHFVVTDRKQPGEKDGDVAEYWEVDGAVDAGALEGAYES